MTGRRLVLVAILSGLVLLAAGVGIGLATTGRPSPTPTVTPTARTVTTAPADLAADDVRQAKLDAIAAVRAAEAARRAAQARAAAWRTERARHARLARQRAAQAAQQVEAERHCPGAVIPGTAVCDQSTVESQRQRWLAEHPGWCTVGTSGAVAPCEGRP